MIKFTSKNFNMFGYVYTRDGIISLCQRDASAQIVMSHKVQYTSFGSIPLTPSLITKWHDRHRYLSTHHVPYLMSLSSPGHCSKTLMDSLCTHASVYFPISVLNGTGSHFNIKVALSDMLVRTVKIMRSQDVFLIFL